MDSSTACRGEALQIVDGGMWVLVAPEGGAGGDTDGNTERLCPLSEQVTSAVVKAPALIA